MITREQANNELQRRCNVLICGDMYPIDMFDYRLMYALSADRKLEIVGNIFKSPELLELCK
jgi:hypothetical protein